ncbi:ADP-ribosylglycohydrolase family protein [Lichenibacterium minor]|uniref:ADP-ribosylglycohydrolase family protein n=1 Tax=Lichenibacterium minor TaxID=2316528 RepID=A0A4Q2U5I4_9HYPH|nr:ADP-ribosylglycohydrolase family protein [Lichenibacterium minor]RYC30311.1 ADP-ribosylglycohydrolase family protein [Lichenibacterium minor]
MKYTDPRQGGIIERARGAMLGLAVGDALGSTLEFGPRIARIADYHREMTGGGPFGLDPGQWTDDTAMAFALAKSLVLRNGFDPHDVMTRFVAWYRRGEYSCTGSCFDIGGTTRQALERFERTGDPFAGLPDEDTAGNGSLMRLAPVALFGLDDEVEAIRIAREQSRLTHAAPVCVDACGYFVQLLRLTILGEEDPLKLALPRWSGHPEIMRAKTALWGGLERRQIRSGGYVVDTLQAALFSCANAPSFEYAVTLAVNLGGDADTVGAIAGALAGAKFGERGIPKQWLEPLAWRHKLGAMALSLVRTSSEVHLDRL